MKTFFKNVIFDMPVATEVDTPGKAVEAVHRLPSKQFMPIPEVRPVKPQQELWNGEASQAKIPTTLSEAILETKIHMIVMGNESQAAMDGKSPKSPIRVEDTNVVDARTALRHVFIPKNQEVDDTDPVVIERRMNGVPPTVDFVDLYRTFMGEQDEKKDGSEGHTSPAQGESIQSYAVGADSIKEIRARLAAKLEGGMHPERAHYDAVIDIVVAAMEADKTHNGRWKKQRDALKDWRIGADNAEADHDEQIESDRPRKLDGGLAMGPTQAVFDRLQVNGYMHHDDPPLASIHEEATADRASKATHEITRDPGTRDADSKPKARIETSKKSPEVEHHDEWVLDQRVTGGLNGNRDVLGIVGYPGYPGDEEAPRLLTTNRSEPASRPAQIIFWPIQRGLLRAK
jgi:hypothetical protein